MRVGGIGFVVWWQQRGVVVVVGRPKKYTVRELRESVNKYFDRISYKSAVLDDEKKPIMNMLGEPIERLNWSEPPTLGGLCRYLGIDRSTWAEYANSEKNPKLAQICAAAKERVEIYLEQELVSRQSGSVRGLEFDLAVNHGWTAKRALELESADKLAVNISVVDEVKSK